MAQSELSFSIDDGIIVLRGMIDRNTVPDLLKGIRLDKLNFEQLKLDLSAVDKVDTAGLAWILKVKAHAERAGLALILQQVPPQLTRLAQLGGVDTLLSE